ncbi:MAG: 5'-methylthioadenosine/S-adenosylhomocysteine nucleosidase [Georgenia sp.]
MSGPTRSVGDVPADRATRDERPVHLQREGRTTVDAVVVGAMAEEVAPFEELAASSAVADVGRLLTVGATRLLVVRSGIGLVNAAAALVRALGAVAPRAVVSTGSAGGLAAATEVGDVVVGTTYTYASADATAFGYERGQVPGMPPAYAGDETLLAAARASGPTVPTVSTGAAGTLRTGQMVSGDSFVTAVNVDAVRAGFPDALSTDMETTALAQVAFGYGLPFLSVRGISDLCGPAADQDFHLAVAEVAARAARVVLAVLGAETH